MAVRIGFSTNVLDNPPDIIESVRQLAKDFQCIELELGDAAERTVYDANLEQYQKIVGELKSLIIEKKLRLSLHAPYIGVTANLAALDEGKRAQSISRLKKSIEFAHDVGVHLVTCHPGLRMKQPQKVLLDQLHKSLAEVVPFAQDLGVQVCVENMGNERPNYIVMTPEEQIEMCKQTGAKITLDLIHLASTIGTGAQLETSLKMLTPYIVNLHIADMVVPQHVHIPIGEGNLPLERCLRILDANGFDGAAIVEEFGGPYDTDTFYRHARAFRHFFENEAV